MSSNFTVIYHAFIRYQVPLRDFLMRLSSSVQRSEGCLGGFVENLEQRLGSTAGAALALFPVAYRLQRDVYASRELGLAQTQTAADTPCVSSRILHGLGLVFGNVPRDVLFGGGVDTSLVNAS